MRVVVAGSHGLIGSALVEHLRDEGHTVVRLVRGVPSGPDEAAWDPDAGALDPASLDGADAVVNLAGVNAGSGSQPGFELLDQQKLGSSDFQQRITYQRALEGEIANTIGQIDGVNGAEVQLTLPEDKLFSDESNPATASSSS